MFMSERRSSFVVLEAHHHEAGWRKQERAHTPTCIDLGACFQLRPSMVDKRKVRELSGLYAASQSIS